MTAMMIEAKAGRSLIDEALFERLVKRITKDEGISRNFAERIMDQALAFLGACAQNPGAPLAPSTFVDISWHTFVLFTRDYREFCERVAGRFIDHVPTDDGDPGVHGKAAHSRLVRTIGTIGAAGFIVDGDLWMSGSSKCTQCHNGCTDSKR